MNGGDRTMQDTVSPEEVVQVSKSNLTAAFSVLPKDRREGMTLFYAFCRMMDDLADENSLGCPRERIGELKIWRDGLERGFTGPTDFQKQIVALVQQYSIPIEYLLNVIDGCLSDLENTNLFFTYRDLQDYMYQVSCSVGLASLRIFGNQDKDADSYALQLGYALQLTNILRDVREDGERGRVYIPREMMDEFGYTRNELFAGNHTDGFGALMRKLAQKAQGHFQRARDVKKTLPKNEQRALIAAEMMRQVYQGILDAMQADDFHVFEKRYGISGARKLHIFIGAKLRSILYTAFPST